MTASDLYVFQQGQCAARDSQGLCGGAPRGTIGGAPGRYDTMRFQLLLCLLSPIEELFPDLCMSWWLPPSLQLERYAKLWPGRVLSILIVWTPILSVVAHLTSSSISPVVTPILVVCIFGAFAIRLYLLGRKLHHVLQSPACKECCDQVAQTELPQMVNRAAVNQVVVDQVLVVDSDDQVAEVSVQSKDAGNASAELCTASSAKVAASDQLEIRRQAETNLVKLLEATDAQRVSFGKVTFDLIEIAEVLYLVVFGSIAAILYTALDDKKWLALVAVGTILIGAFFMAKNRHRNQKLDVFGRVVFACGFVTNLYNLNRADNQL